MLPWEARGRRGTEKTLPTIPLLSCAGKSFSLTGASRNLVSMPTRITLESWGLILLDKPEVPSWWAPSWSLSPASRLKSENLPLVGGGYVTGTGVLGYWRAG